MISIYGVRHRVALAALSLASFACFQGDARAAGDPEHLIICPAEYESIFQELADHRTMADVSSAVVTIEDIFATTPAGRDDAETLRNYIVAEFARGALRYVLLGGDLAAIPSRTIENRFYPTGGSTQLEVDLYYAGLDGDWDADGDGIFGEGVVGFGDEDEADMDPDIGIGRAPISSVNEARRFVDGVMAYDNATGAAYYGFALMLAEVLFPSDWSPGQPITLDGATYGEDMVGRLLSHPSPTVSRRFYENVTPYIAAGLLNRETALRELGSGEHGLVFYAGHGVLDQMSVGDARSISLILPGCKTHRTSVSMFRCSAKAPA